MKAKVIVKQKKCISGNRPQESKSSIVRVKFGGKKTEGINRWAAEVRDIEDNNVTISVTPGADSLIGRYQLYVETSSSEGQDLNRVKFEDEFILLFNAWCKGRYLMFIEINPAQS